MRYLLAILIAAAPIAPAPALAQESVSVPSGPEMQIHVLELFRSGKAAEAIEVVDPILADFDRRFAGDTRTRRCLGDSVIGKLIAPQLQTAVEADLVLVPNDWCFALWAKGYALVEQRKIRESVPYLEQAVAMSPENPLYLSELGNSYQELRRWEPALDMYTRAAAAAERMEGRERTLRLGRAWRGIGFVLIELGKWDEAVTWFNKALELDPNDLRAKQELEYIRQNRP